MKPTREKTVVKSGSSLKGNKYENAKIKNVLY